MNERRSQNTICKNCYRKYRQSYKKQFNEDWKRIYINYLNPEAKRKEIPVNEFKDYLIHLSQSGIFADTINWRYVDLFNSGKYLIEGDINHNNGYELSVTMATKNKEDKDRVVKILGESEE